MSVGKKLIFLELYVCKLKANSALNDIEKEVASPKGVGGVGAKKNGKEWQNIQNEPGKITLKWGLWPLKSPSYINYCKIPRVLSVNEPLERTTENSIKLSFQKT